MPKLHPVFTHGVVFSGHIADSALSAEFATSALLWIIPDCAPALRTCPARRGAPELAGVSEPSRIGPAASGGGAAPRHRLRLIDNCWQILPIRLRKWPRKGTDPMAAFDHWNGLAQMTSIFSIDSRI